MHVAGGLWCVLSTPGTAVPLHGWTALFILSFPAFLISFLQHELCLGGSDDGQQVNIGNIITSLADNPIVLPPVALSWGVSAIHHGLIILCFYPRLLCLGGVLRFNSACLPLP